MDAKTLLLNSLHTRWAKYQAELKNCRREFSEEAVHDFRVAARRLLSSLDLLRAVMQNPGIRKLRRILKIQLDNLDDLRDIQVLLSDISENIQEVPHLQPFEEYLQHREKKLMRAVRREINSLKKADLPRRIRKLFKTIETFTQTGLDASLFSALDEANAIILQRYALVDTAQPATIHHLRIAFKKFRYMIEAVYPMLEDFPADHPKRMHDYQSAMGDIQDMEVALQELAEFDKQAPADYDPKPLRSYYKKRHTFAISCYIENKGEVVTFWRSAPDQPFPKEK
jgi:CHAD domain-containing protein